MNQEERWHSFWKDLEGQALDDIIPVLQYNGMLHLWQALSKEINGLRKPSIEASVSSPGSFYFSWSFTDIPHELVTVDIDPMGQYDWYYWNASDFDKTFEGLGDLNAVLKAIIPVLKCFKGNSNA